VRNPLRWFRRWRAIDLVAVEAAPESQAKPPSHNDLVAEAMRIRAEVREKLGEDTVRKLYKLATGKDAPPN
jgi:hypothetical protein